MLLQQKQSPDIVSHKNHEMPFALKLQMQKAFLNYCNQQDFFFSCTLKINDHKRNKHTELITETCCSEVCFSYCNAVTEMRKVTSVDTQLTEHQG